MSGQPAHVHLHAACSADMQERTCWLSTTTCNHALEAAPACRAAFCHVVAAGGPPAARCTYPMCAWCLWRTRQTHQVSKAWPPPAGRRCYTTDFAPRVCTHTQYDEMCSLHCCRSGGVRHPSGVYHQGAAKPAHLWLQQPSRWGSLYVMMRCIGSMHCA